MRLLRQVRWEWLIVVLFLAFLLTGAFGWLGGDSWSFSTSCRSAGPLNLFDIGCVDNGWIDSHIRI